MALLFGSVSFVESGLAEAFLELDPIARLAFVALRTPPMPYRLLKLADATA